MRIHQLIGGPAVIITNEERDFIKRHHNYVMISKLHDRDEVLARNLVRKGIYEVSNDSTHIILKQDSSSVRDRIE